MGKIVKETGHQSFEPPVGVNQGCGLCPSGCRTVCVRKNVVDMAVVQGEMEDFALNPLQTDHGTFRRKRK